VSAQVDRAFTTVSWFDRLLGLIKNLGRHSAPPAICSSRVELLPSAHPCRSGDTPPPPCYSSPPVGSTRADAAPARPPPRLVLQRAGAAPRRRWLSSPRSSSPPTLLILAGHVLLGTSSTFLARLPRCARYSLFSC
jgi:hypothetical protein